MKPIITNDNRTRIVYVRITEELHTKLVLEAKARRKTLAKMIREVLTEEVRED